MEKQASNTEAGGPSLPLSLFKSRDEWTAPAGEMFGPSSSTTAEDVLPYAAGYSWTVKKWLRPDLEGKDEMIGEVSFEWRRSRRKNLTRIVNKRRRRMEEESQHALSRTNTANSARRSASTSSVYLPIPEERQGKTMDSRRSSVASDYQFRLVFPHSFRLIRL